MRIIFFTQRVSFTQRFLCICKWCSRMLDKLIKLNVNVSINENTIYIYSTHSKGQ